MYGHVYVASLTEEFNNVSSPFGDFVVRVIDHSKMGSDDGVDYGGFTVVVAVGKCQVCELSVDVIGDMWVTRNRNDFTVKFAHGQVAVIPFSLGGA